MMKTGQVTGKEKVRPVLVHVTVTQSMSFPHELARKGFSTEKPQRLVI